jgi:hypothetical protein
MNPKNKITDEVGKAQLCFDEWILKQKVTLSVSIHVLARQMAARWHLETTTKLRDECERYAKALKKIAFSFPDDSHAERIIRDVAQHALSPTHKPEQQEKVCECGNPNDAHTTSCFQHGRGCWYFDSKHVLRFCQQFTPKKGLV